MGLITCQDCGRQVSEQAVACPQCGRPMNPPTGHATLPLVVTGATEPKEGLFLQTLNGGCGCLLVLLAFAFLAGFLGKLLD